jgi:hypothetical protein
MNQVNRASLIGIFDVSSIRVNLLQKWAMYRVEALRLPASEYQLFATLLRLPRSLNSGKAEL